MLVVQQLSASFGGLVVVDRLEFLVERGTIHSLIGPNGAGKTTVLNLISGFHRAIKGRIQFQGRNLLHLPPHRIAQLGVGRTFQQSKVFASLSVLENVMVAYDRHMRSALWANCLGLTKKEEQRAQEAARSALHLVGLEPRRDALVQSLPPGQQRFVELARAQVFKPQLLLLDEPSAGMSERERAHLEQLVQHLKAQGLTVLLVEHHMPLVMELSDRVTVLNYGRRIAQGTPKEIQQDPAVILAYLGRRQHDEPGRDAARCGAAPAGASGH